MDIILLSILSVVWLIAFILTYEYFINTNINRFRFRYWTVVSFLHLMQVTFAIIYKLFDIISLQNVRWVIFNAASILMLEIFIYKAQLSRKEEIFIRIFYMLFAILEISSNSGMYYTINAIILVYVTYRAKEYYFIWVFFVNCFVVICPMLFSFTGVASLLLGVVYSGLLLQGIYGMYKKERIHEKLMLQNTKEIGHP